MEDNQKEVLSVRVPKEVKEYILLYCKEHETKLSDLVTDLLITFILE